MRVFLLRLRSLFSLSVQSAWLFSLPPEIGVILAVSESLLLGPVVWPLGFLHRLRPTFDLVSPAAVNA
jgi:hypothetical protein